jgi:hypothetical protein
MGTKEIIQLLLEMCGKDGPSVRDDDLQYTMIEDDVGDV